MIALQKSGKAVVVVTDKPRVALGVNVRSHHQGRNPSRCRSWKPPSSSYATGCGAQEDLRPL